MKLIVLTVLLAGAAVAQPAGDSAKVDPVKQGEQVFGRTCANGYCHGLKGVAGGAPRLAARGFDQTYINNTVSRGLTGTSMPGFAGTLPRSDLAAVVAYVGSLNGIAGTGPAPEPRKFSAEAARGRDLFSDSLRDFARCSTCHEVNGIGLAVTTPIADVPADVRGLRNLPTPSVRTAVLGKMSMPALGVSEGKRAAVFYDLTSTPPVLRTADPGSVQWNEGSEWRHSSVIGAYNDAELAAVLEYLREAVK